MLPCQCLAFGAEEGVALGLVVEGTAVEQAVWVDAALGRYMGHDSDLFAAAGVFSVRVAGVGDDIECRRLAQRLTCGLGHRQQATVVRCVECYRVRHDQRVLGIDGGLNVVSR